MAGLTNLETKLSEVLGVGEVVEGGIPMQQRHFQEARAGFLRLAAEEDPNETA